MELIEVILSKENLNRAYKKVVANKGASGVDGVTVEELGDYIRKNREKIVTSLRNRTYIPKPVRRVYIPKDNGKKRPLGIPTALDRTIQQAIAQPISDIYEEIFSDYSYGFRAGRSCHDAIRQALEYLNDGYEWVVDIDIEQFFDKVNHDKLIQILREQVNDSTTLNLIRKYLKAGVMENGLEKATITGVPQGGPLSVVCSNVYLDKLDKELEHRGLRFTRYADDVLIFTKSEMAANRVMNSISDWLERKLFLKVNATKTKVVRPMRSKYLGFTFLKNGGEWKVKPTNEKKKKLKKKLSEYLKRGKTIARPLLGFTFYCGRSRKGMPYIMPKTSSKKFRQKIRDIKVWLYANRDQPLKKLMGMLNLKLIGHYRYYGISFNGRMISNYKQQVRELLFKVLNRRSDRKSYTREGFIEMLKYYPLAMPKIYVSLF